MSLDVSVAFKLSDIHACFDCHSHMKRRMYRKTEDSVRAMQFALRGS